MQMAGQNESALIATHESSELIFEPFLIPFSCTDTMPFEHLGRDVVSPVIVGSGRSWHRFGYSGYPAGCCCDNGMLAQKQYTDHDSNFKTNRSNLWVSPICKDCSLTLTFLFLLAVNNHQHECHIDEWCCKRRWSLFHDI